MKATELFSPYDGIDSKKSTLEERQELWKIMFEKQLIAFQDETVELEIGHLGNEGIYFSGLGVFNINFMDVDDVHDNVKNHIPFEEFKQLLTQLKLWK